jgi:hypothetical protein
MLIRECELPFEDKKKHCQHEDSSVIIQRLVGPLKLEWLTTGKAVGAFVLDDLVNISKAVCISDARAAKFVNPPLCWSRRESHFLKVVQLLLSVQNHPTEPS